jgi:hypothetical protein
MDSSVSPTHGEQEMSVWNGHYASTCYHPLFVFNQFGDLDRQRAEKRFKQEERAKDGRKAMTEYEIQGRATREKTERLKALRLAKEAQAQTEAATAKPTKRRPARREKKQLSALRRSA